MKRKIYFATMLCLMMLMGIPTQAQTQKQRARNVVKVECTPETGYKMIERMDQTPTNEYTVQRHGDLLQYTPKHAGEGTPTDTATVTLMYNLQEEDFGQWFVNRVMVYNNDWTGMWDTSPFNQDGSPVKGITVKVPVGTYDIYSNSSNNNSGIRYHIDELVVINNDTTISLDVIDAEKLVCWKLYDENWEPLLPNTKEETGHLYLDLAGYGNVLDHLHWYINGDLSQEIPDQYPFRLYFNELSDRYKFTLLDVTSSKEKVYVNRLSKFASEVFPMKPTPTDYVAYEMPAMGKESVENPSIGFKINFYVDNLIMGDYISGANGPLYSPISSDGTARVMINAPKQGDNNQLTGYNVEFQPGVEYTRSVYIVEGEGEYTSVGYNYGPNMMVNPDQTIECINHEINVPTSEPLVWKPEYPGHPKFSFKEEQKQGVFGNNCPLNVITSQNRTYDWSDSKFIILQSENKGRYGEELNSANSNSSMLVKYNDEEIYSGPNNLYGLMESWFENPNPDGVYEMTFTRTNFEVDDFPGKNVTTIYFDQTKGDMNSPVLRMLQFRDGDNNVTDRFEVPDQGIIMFAAGDFELNSVPFFDEEYGRENVWEYYDCQPMTVEVSYAPYGTDEWQPLEGIEHQEEYDDIPGMGFFYSGSLASVDRESENGWFDLKFRLVDEAGNWQEQTLSPAFRIDALEQSAVSEVCDGSAHEVARYSIDGKRVNTNHSGIVIVKMSDGTARKVLVP